MVLVGVVIVIVGMVFRINALLVVAVAGYATGLAAGISIVDITAIIGKAFATNRYMSLFILVLPVIGLLERNGLRERAEQFIAGIGTATAGRIMWLYMLIRQITVGLGITIGGHPAFVRPLIAPMAEAAAEKQTHVLSEKLREQVKACAAMADNLANFFGQNLFIAAGGLLLIKGVLEEKGYPIDLFTMVIYTVPTALAALVIAFMRYQLLDRKLTAIGKEGKRYDA